MHEELGLAHGALSCSTILLDLNGRVKIGKFERERVRAALLILSQRISAILLSKIDG